MKIVLLAAGSGTMYCGACARDAALVRLLMSLGHDAVVMPLYTPIRLEGEPPAPPRPVLLGGVNAYLDQVLPSYGRWPAPIRNLMDRPGLLAWASRFAVRTRAADLGPMTVSVLEGPKGRHSEEILRVARAAAREEPDFVVISNSLLLSLAPALRQAGKFRIVCQVQGEDGFLDELPEPWRAQAVALMRGHTGTVDLFLAPSRCHAEEMAGRLDVPIDRFAVLPHPAPAFDPLPFPTGPPTIGHLSSMRRAKGLDTLLRAMVHLPPDVRLLIGGRVLEPAFHKEVRRLARPLGGRVRFEGEIAPAHKRAFFESVDAVALPSRLRESRGLVAFEALAGGRPVVASHAGVYEEMADKTPGVILHEPDDPQDLARVLRGVLGRTEAARLGGLGREMVLREYASDIIALQGEALLKALVNTDSS